MTAHKRDYLQITDFSTEELEAIFQLAARLKKERREGTRHHLLAGKTLALIFQKPSLRTRLSFETGMYELGGHAIYLAPHTIGFGVRESVKDIAKVTSRYNDIIMARVFEHAHVVELAREADVPVLNGLSDLCHPCQVGADALTIWERRGNSLDGARVVYSGDGNNVANSLINLARRFPMELTIACPEGYDPDPDFLAAAREDGKGTITISRDLMDAVAGVDMVYTDVWASMGQEDQLEKRKKDFGPFQVTMEVMEAAGPQARFMHDLPANRGLEATDEVMDSEQSIIYDQAENRLHIQKALMVTLLGAA